MGHVFTPVASHDWQIPLGALLLGLLAFYILALDQGLLLSLVQGNVAFDKNLVHEVVHDARHAAGFPCH